MTRDSEGQMRKARLRALDVLAAPLAGHGLRKARKKGLFFEPRDDGAFLVVAIASARSEHPRVASAVAVHAGLGLAPEVGDLRVTNVHPLPFVLGSGPACAKMCVVHEEIVAGWRPLGDDAARVATLLSWNVRDDWRNAAAAGSDTRIPRAVRSRAPVSSRASGGFRRSSKAGR